MKNNKLITLLRADTSYVFRGLVLAAVAGLVLGVLFVDEFGFVQDSGSLKFLSNVFELVIILPIVAVLVLAATKLKIVAPLFTFSISYLFYPQLADICESFANLARIVVPAEISLSAVEATANSSNMTYSISRLMYADELRNVLLVMIVFIVVYIGVRFTLRAVHHISNNQSVAALTVLFILSSAVFVGGRISADQAYYSVVKQRESVHIPSADVFGGAQFVNGNLRLIIGYDKLQQMDNVDIELNSGLLSTSYEDGCSSAFSPDNTPNGNRFGRKVEAKEEIVSSTFFNGLRQDEVQKVTNAQYCFTSGHATYVLHRENVDENELPHGFRAEQVIDIIVASETYTPFCLVRPLNLLPKYCDEDETNKIEKLNFEYTTKIATR